MRGAARGPFLWGGRPRPHQLLLALLFTLAAGLRFVHYNTVNTFTFDQGAHYLAVMEWLREGPWPGLSHWPLVGPWRSATDDFTLGPGYYYLLLPFVALSGAHPAAGMLMIGLASLAEAALVYRWLVRAGGGLLRAPALVTVTVLLLSPDWVQHDRMLWNPNLLALGTVLLATALQRFATRPWAWLALMLLLAGLLPQCHTSGWLQVGVAFPFGLWLVRRHRAALAAVPARARWPWLGLLAAGWALLFVPPLIHELRGPDHFFATYFLNTLAARPPSDYLLNERLLFSFNQLSWFFLSQVSGWPLRDVDPLRWSLAMAWLGALMAGLRTAERGAPITSASPATPAAPAPARLASDPSPLYLTLLCAAFIVLAVKQGEFFQLYYMIGIYHVPLILTGWLATVALASTAAGANQAEAARPPAARRVLRLATWAVLALGLGLAAARLPESLRRVSTPNPGLRGAHEIAARIQALEHGRAFSLQLVEPWQMPDHFHVLLWRLGQRPANHRPRDGRMTLDEMGEELVLIVRGAARGWRPTLSGGLRMEDLLPPVEVADAWLLRLPRAALPAGTRAVTLSVDHNAGAWTLTAD